MTKGGRGLGGNSSRPAAARPPALAAERRGAAPAARHVYGLAYDPRLRRVVMVGGQSFSRPRVYYDDAWTWDGSQWAELPRVGDAAPIGRAGGALVSDARNQRLLYFGGYRGVPQLQELWQLDARGWRRLDAPADSTR